VNNEIVKQLDAFAAPYGREITLESVEHDSGLHMLRIRIREGRRFTVMDIDADTAVHWSSAMGSWAGEARAMGS
jgi:hypothetical protein